MIWRGMRARLGQATAPRQGGTSAGSEENAPDAPVDHPGPSASPAPPTPDVYTGEKQADREVAALLGEDDVSGSDADPDVITPGPPLNRRSPFLIGLLAVLGAFTGYAIVSILTQLSTIIVHIVIALFIALGVEPIVAALNRSGVSRIRAVLVVLLGLSVFGALLSWLILPPIVDQINILIQQTPTYLNDISNSSWVERLNRRWEVSDLLLEKLEASIDQRTVTSVFGGILGVGKAFADGILAVFTVVVLSIYFVAAMPQVKGAVYKLVPHSRRARVVYLSEEISHRVGRYLLAQIVLALINAMFSYVILVALDLPYPAVLATVIGLLALIPILGTLVGGTIITLVALSAGWLTALGVLAYYIGYHLLETYVIAPRIMSHAVEVPPVITIVAVLAGGTLLGVVGALIAIPVVAGLLLLYHQVAVPRQQRM